MLLICLGYDSFQNESSMRLGLFVNSSNMYSITLNLMIFSRSIFLLFHVLLTETWEELLHQTKAGRELWMLVTTSDLALQEVDIPGNAVNLE